MAQAVVTEPFGEYVPGDVVDVPDGAELPSYLKPQTAVAEDSLTDEARAKVEQAEKDLAAAEAADKVEN